MIKTLTDAALTVLQTADPWEKARLTQQYADQWRDDDINNIGAPETVPDRPARPAQPELKHPHDMPRRKRSGSKAGKIALLHAIAHIELNAIDLSWDIIARFAHYATDNVANPDTDFCLPKAFFDDWVKVADDEARHFLMLSERLTDFDADYGDLPAHDGLWEASEKTAEDFAARLAVVPMVLEARGLDVTPGLIQSMKSSGDDKTAALFQIIHDDEVTHVGAGTTWFEHWCDYYGKDVEETWQDLVKQYFGAPLKRPFNHPGRHDAGMLRHWYEPLADD